jgi:hypothetical protein
MSKLIGLDGKSLSTPTMVNLSLIAAAERMLPEDARSWLEQTVCFVAKKRLVSEGLTTAPTEDSTKTERETFGTRIQTTILQALADMQTIGMITSFDAASYVLTAGSYRFEGPVALYDKGGAMIVVPVSIAMEMAQGAQQMVEPSAA